MAFFDTLINNVKNVRAALISLLSIALTIYFYPYANERLPSLGEYVLFLSVFGLFFCFSVCFIFLCERVLAWINGFWKKRKQRMQYNEKLRLKKMSLNEAIPQLPKKQRMLLYVLYEDVLDLEVDSDVNSLASQGVLIRTMSTGVLSNCYKLNPDYKDVVDKHKDSIYEEECVPWIIKFLDLNEINILRSFYQDMHGFSDDGVIRLGSRNAIDSLKDNGCVIVEENQGSYSIRLDEKFGPAFSRVEGFGDPIHDALRVVIS
ncbi:hypothetical protein ACFO0U_04845 [Chromohalobacter sarecensis]|uniref:Uncharacterized protein n=1 Tax=Chromohalobacter sarecensis TaxID=245294 RepID=A0ABV9CZ59_9GAMM|nr:hypothetical protein [Chromohalobacter sarecensis]MCK0713382.1 hypothetical protein [Chromohalobacter sarecensis]